jgi:hypothetical protein
MTKPNLKIRCIGGPLNGEIVEYIGNLLMIPPEPEPIEQDLGIKPLLPVHAAPAPIHYHRTVFTSGESRQIVYVVEGMPADAHER